MADKLRAQLYLNMILAEDEPVEMVKRSLNSLQDSVDGMYIAVTYKDTPTDAASPLLQLLQKYNATVFPFQWVYDFSAARQFVMDKTPKGDNCYIYWQDADDVLVNSQKLHQLADDAYQKTWAAITLEYQYMVDLDEQGDVREILVRQKRERIVRNDDGFKWIGALHETLIEQRFENVLKYNRNECYLVHLTSPERLDKNLDRNIEILEKMLEKEQRRDPRTIIYLAKAYYDKAKMQATVAERQTFFDQAIVLFYEFLNGGGTPGSANYRPGSGWPDERSQAWDYIGQIALMTQNVDIAIHAFQSAIDEAPQYTMYYINLAMAYVIKNDIKKAKHWLWVASHVIEPETTVLTTPRDLKTKTLEVDYAISLAEGRLDQAKIDVQLLLTVLPDNPELKERLQFIESLWFANKASQSFVFIGKYLEQIKETDKMIPLLNAIPRDLQDEKFASEMRHLYIPPRVHDEREISILCGPGWEQWSPRSLENGLGGSEEAVVYLSQELAKKGWKVTVYANPQKEAGEYDGVMYKTWHDLNVKDVFNVLVLWRSIGFIDFEPKARFTLTWLHDVPNNPDFTVKRVEQVNKIAVLSEYHKSLLRYQKPGGEFAEMPGYKVFLTGNGIPDITTPDVTRNPKRIIYSSSPDRGLIYLLTNWEAIRKGCPEAELHVYYGFDVFDVIHKNNPTQMEWKANLMQLLKQPGITYHGRVGHTALEAEMAKAGIWAYPTDFDEISCITAMKAQALGAVPFVTNRAALQETVKNGIRIDADITDEETQATYVAELIKLLNNPKEQEVMRQAMMPWAREHFHWEHIAASWDQLFSSYLQNPERALAEKYVT